jgi:hypothetical protein
MLAALGRSGCAEICVAVMSPTGSEWKIMSDVYYDLTGQTRMPWATYAKLTNYLVDTGFLVKTKRAIGRRKINLVRLTSSGKELVKLYLNVLGKGLKDLQAEPKPREIWTNVVR